MSLVLAIGVIARICLIPLHHGQDFVVWDKATTATLHGVNIYAHHPDYPGGPFAYFPVFLYIELPFQWLAQHSALSFTVSGKLPILASDIAVAGLIARITAFRGHSKARVAVATAVFFLNPLVIYNSAYYGRFDSLSCALLLMGYWRTLRDRSTRPRAAISYALAGLSKTFPFFVFPGLLRESGRHWLRTLGLTVVVTIAVSLPYVGTLHAFFHDIVLYDTKRPPGYLSWQHLVLKISSVHTMKLVGYGLLAVVGLASIGLCWWIRSIEMYIVVVLLLFILCTKVVLEQYLTWPLPWLAILAFAASDRIRYSSAGLAIAFTALGLLNSESYHPFGRSSAGMEIALAVSSLTYIVVTSASWRSDSFRRTDVLDSTRPRTPAKVVR